VVTLRPMTEAEYEPYMRLLREDYARERAESGDTPIEEEREASERQIAGLLQQGLHTPAHLFWSVVAPPDTAIGALWVQVDEAKKRAFIYDINLREDQRGQGGLRPPDARGAGG